MVSFHSRLSGEFIFLSVYKQRDKNVATGYFIFNIFLLQIAVFYFIFIF